MVKISYTAYLNTVGLPFPAQAEKVNRSTKCSPVGIFIFSISFFFHGSLRKDKFVFVWRLCEVCVQCVGVCIHLCMWVCLSVCYVGVGNCWNIACCVIIIYLNYLYVVPQLVSRCHYVTEGEREREGADRGTLDSALCAYLQQLGHLFSA